jgi:DNA-binding response OmpR family regulator
MSLINNLKILMGKKEISEEEVREKQPSQKILIVEDEKSLADVLELEFKEAGYEVKKAENGQIGLNMLNSYDPDIIILDLLMPVMDGKTMLHEIRKIPRFKKLPVIILTNAGEIDNMRETQLYYDAASFFVKSNIDTEEILKRVKSLI